VVPLLSGFIKNTGEIEMPTTRDKRLFHLAELLAAELNRSKGDVQPEDIVSFMQCHVPMTAEEADEDFEETKREMIEHPSAGRLALQRLRTALGFVPGDSLISVMEKAAEVCERGSEKSSIPEALQEKLQKLTYYLTKEAARTSYREFLEFLDINESEYEKIKKIWKDRLGVKPYV
jgi:hypothetical protein